MRRVLYVEDDAINALVVKKLLEREFDVTNVDDGEACLRLIKNEKFDIILMDINLGRGKMDGVETMKQIKLIKAYSSTPVIAVTSYAMPGDRRRFLKEGFDFYFEKPIERHALISQINWFLDKSALDSRA
ncbi:MAG TPA: response regulator [Cyclobacteriaceae bacterium]|nr:response regulator [Cyclobacteriaceae bacterium]